MLTFHGSFSCCTQAVKVHGADGGHNGGTGADAFDVRAWLCIPLPHWLACDACTPTQLTAVQFTALNKQVTACSNA